MEREEASKEFERMATELAGPDLASALEERPTDEVRRRVQKLLGTLAGPVASPEGLQAMRAVEVLERIGSAEVRKLLEKLAKGAPEARLTQDAKASLERLARKATSASTGKD